MLPATTTSSTKKLAINGGVPVRTAPFPPYRTIGEEEKAAVGEVLDSGVLSDFLATWSPQFYGGPRVRRLEQEWQQYFGVRHAVAMNSGTSALYAAIGAAGVEPGDEVIVSPITMTASASAALVYGALPVFADIDPDTFCITAETIEQRLSPSTRVIMAVDILGHPADMDPIIDLARRRGLTVIEDAAQAPGAKYNGRYAGTLADIGVFSLNSHKTIQSGEGGVAVTNDDRLAERLQLIRNHAEMVVEGKGVTDLVNMVGFNYRMTEIEAAIAYAQLEKLEDLLLPRIAAADYLSEHLRNLPGITTPVVGRNVRHAYYLYPVRYDENVSGVPRDRIVDALNAEGIPMVKGYTAPLYFAPLYQQRIAFGNRGFPFNYNRNAEEVSYRRGICPVAERMWERELMVTNVCRAGVTQQDLLDVVLAFEKVLGHADELL
jgi:dTDP-4-amino-4,6-dideoxygalactose transaminase